MALPRLWKLSLIAVAVLIAALAVRSHFSGHSIAPNELCLETPASGIRGRKEFKYLPQGHGGATTQYAANSSDKDGGYYCVECQGAKITAVYVSYDKPVSRNICLQTIRRFVGKARLLETDSTELAAAKPDQSVFFEALESNDKLPQSEYFYFANGNYAELQYLNPSRRGISRIICYRGS